LVTALEAAYAFANLFWIESLYSAKAKPKAPMPRATMIRVDTKSNVSFSLPFFGND
jgi:hypothetical protein